MSVFNVRQPKDTSSLIWSNNLSSRMVSTLDRKQAFIDSECIRLMSRFTPIRSGTLRDSATVHTVIGTGVIKQQTPYARRQYYEHKSKSRWFEVMKNRYKDEILRGAEKI